MAKVGKPLDSRRRSPPPSAQPPSPTAAPVLLPGGFLPLHPVRLLFDLDVGGMFLDRQTATQHQIGTAGVSFGGTLGIDLYDIFSMTFAGALGFPSDNNSFSQVVAPVGDPNNTTTATSTLMVAHYSLALGARTPFWALGSTARAGSQARCSQASAGRESQPTARSRIGKDCILASST